MRQLLPYILISHFPIGWKCSYCGQLFQIEIRSLDASGTDPNQSVTTEFRLHSCKPSKEQQIPVNAPGAMRSARTFPQIPGELKARAAEPASERPMQASDDITWEQFQEKFKEAFGREMKSDEHLWFRSMWRAENRAKKRQDEAA